jgi:hypothetical protein
MFSRFLIMFSRYVLFKQCSTNLTHFNPSTMDPDGDFHDDGSSYLLNTDPPSGDSLSVVHNHPEWKSYVEHHIHAKRHLFANHLIQHYPFNLGRQGNQPAESNHSSVLARLGAAFYESPLKLIAALLERHCFICGERDHEIKNTTLTHPREHIVVQIQRRKKHYCL